MGAKLYEFINPNVGNYSPTNLLFAKSAPEALHLMRNEDFKFTNDVVLFATLDSIKLEASTSAKMNVTSEGIRIQANSSTTSMLLLPIQYSNCLNLDSSNAKLVRANLIFTGLVFTGNVDTNIKFQYSPFQNECRKSDILDMKNLMVTKDPSLAQKSTAPWAIKLDNMW
jgi:hypothetical protein